MPAGPGYTLDMGNQSPYRQSTFSSGKYCSHCGRIFGAEYTARNCPQDSAPLVEVGNPFQNMEIGRNFEVLELLGCGGWGLVFKARQLSFNRFVAVKMLHRHLMNRTDLVERFYREAALISRMNHPNITQIIDYGTLKTGEPFLIMEFLNGTNLGEIIRQHGPVAPALTYFIVMQVCDALSAAHAQQIIHRDMKPSNISIIGYQTENVLAKIMDFGFAKALGGAGLESEKLTQTGYTIGTPAYMSPELCRAQPADQRTDVYSLGCVMYEMLSGRAPYGGANAFETMHQHLHDAPAPFAALGITVPPAVQKIVFKAMAKKPADRFQSVEEMRVALDKCANDTGGSGFFGLNHVVSLMRKVLPNASGQSQALSVSDQPTPADAQNIAALGFSINMEGDDSSAEPLDEQTLVPRFVEDETAPLGGMGQQPVDLDFLSSSCGPEVARDLIAAYIVTAERLLKHLETARAAGNMQSVEVLAHQLNSSAQSVGAAQMMRLAANLEGAARRQDTKQVAVVCQALDWALTNLRKFISEHA